MRKEAQSVFTDAKKVPTREQMDTMDYSLATLKEVLRLYSVVPVVTRVTVVRPDTAQAASASLTLLLG